MKSSVMILTGLGGKEFSKRHAHDSAKLINILQPDYLSTLILSYPYGVDHFSQKFDGTFQEMTPWSCLLSSISLSRT